MRDAPEDIAHISVRATRAEVEVALTQYFRDLGYRKHPVKSEVHLQTHVDWNSPFDPSPEFRLFMLLPTQSGWTNVTDELDVLDLRLVKRLSFDFDVIAVRGYSNLSQFEYTFWHEGTPLRETELSDPIGNAVLEFLRGNEDHVTRFSYDDLGLSLSDKQFDELVFLGFRRALA